MQENQLNDQRPEWLKNMAEKTWNLEMIISGAAIYLTSFLPDLVDQSLYYFLDNIQVDQDPNKASLPILAYSFMKMVALLLPFSFIIHFIMRAFWASMVGLHTVYPEGIRFQHIPGYSDFMKEVMEEDFGKLSDFIGRLDKWCNQVFAIAFSVVLLGAGISTVYMIIFFFNKLLPLFLPADIIEIVVKIINSLMVLVAITLMACQYAIKNLDREKYPQWSKMLIKFIRVVPATLLPFFYRPSSYLTFTFSSNMSKRRFYSIMGIFSVIIFTVFTVILLSTMSEIRGSRMFSFQNFFGKNKNQYTLIASQYDDTRLENARISGISIPSEIVEGSFLKIFVAYPKYLDQTLTLHCTEPDFPDSIAKSRRRVMADSLRADCISQNLQLRINDSLYRKTDWLFHRHNAGGHLGLVTFVPTQGFKTGKNQLSVSLPSAITTDSLISLGALPFWFGG